MALRVGILEQTVLRDNVHVSDDVVEDESAPAYDRLVSVEGRQKFYGWLENEMSLKSVELEEHEVIAILSLFYGGDSNILMDLLDMFDVRCSGVYTRRIVYLLVCFLAASVEGKRLHFLHLLGREVFDELRSDNEDGRISTTALKVMGYMSGISEYDLTERMKLLNLHEQDSFSMEEFEVFYFSCFKELDDPSWSCEHDMDLSGKQHTTSPTTEITSRSTSSRSKCSCCTVL